MTSTLLKYGVIFAIFSIPSLSWYNSVLISLFVTWVYQYLIAFFFGVHAMPSMDAICFLSKDTARINFISVTTVDKYDFLLAKKRARTFIETKNKLRYSVVEILGDYYWKDSNDIDRLVD